MNKNKIYFLLLFTITASFLFLFTTSFGDKFSVLLSHDVIRVPEINASEEEEKDPCPDYQTVSTTYYRCQHDGCGANVQKQTRSCTYDSCTSSGCTPPPPTAGGWSTDTEGKSWEKCHSPSPYSENQDDFSSACDKDCLGIPTDPRYYDDLHLSYNDPSSYPWDNVYLPVQLAWKNVAGWGQETGPQSYRIEIDNTNFSGQWFLSEEGVTFPEGIIAPGIIDGQFNWPTTCKIITSPYGPRKGGFHAGIDIAGCKNRTISASYEGVVIDRRNNTGGFGNAIIIEHNINGKIYRTLYAHLERPASVNIGERVQTGQPIGIMGTTGYSTGVHLHFEIGTNCLGFRITNETRVGCSFDPLKILIEGSGGGVTDEEFDSLPSFLNPTSGFPYLDEGQDFDQVLNKNSFRAHNCLLKSGDEHNWRVQACCGYDGTECKDMSFSHDWQIKTRKTPEVLGPFGAADGPGWGTESNPSLVHHLEDANLRWCETKFQRDIYEDGEPVDSRKRFPDRYEVDVLQKTPWLFFWSRFHCHPFLLTYSKICDPIRRFSPSPVFAPPGHAMNEDFILFTKNDYAEYQWRVRACIGPIDIDENCTDAWDEVVMRQFSISEDVTVLKPALRYPPENSTVSWPISFKWASSLGANSYIFELRENGKPLIENRVVESQITEERRVAREHTLIVTEPEVIFKPDTSYEWRVRSCWDHAGHPARCEDEWSESSFKTTGRPPEIEYQYPPYGDLGVTIPFKFSWESIPGARSYSLSINGRNYITDINEFEASYPIVSQNTSYDWAVSSCNGPQANDCGSSSLGFFKTLALASPNIQSPPAGAGYFLDKTRGANLSWEPVLGANYYLLKVSCDGEELINEIITSTLRGISLDCIGTHSMEVYGCTDSNCLDKGVISLRTFEVIESGGFGLVPCGLTLNNPDTPWNERDACGFRHLFILLKRLIDLILWELTPLALVVMVVISAVLFYTSMGNVEVITRIKEIWKSVGKGILIMLLSWTVISLLMMVIGYNFGIYGQWYQITF